jgi:hypothetical protein
MDRGLAALILCLPTANAYFKRPLYSLPSNIHFDAVGSSFGGGAWNDCKSFYDEIFFVQVLLAL